MSAIGAIAERPLSGDASASADGRSWWKADVSNQRVEPAGETSIRLVVTVSVLGHSITLGSTLSSACSTPCTRTIVQGASEASFPVLSSAHMQKFARLGPNACARAAAESHRIGGEPPVNRLSTAARTLTLWPMSAVLCFCKSRYVRSRLSQGRTPAQPEVRSRAAINKDALMLEHYRATECQQVGRKRTVRFRAATRHSRATHPGGGGGSRRLSGCLRTMI
ncbi:hypothetical protein GGQ80_003212 [Sphingomonas jinjuensis]|uniref:Uncharacterized protein n=1 Tax=Sphingomonas jinjuensis TaxID=535907 RepID=A0A840FF38_9SPHN|nr:hypothetical protein [Sphingomonas jinjuensis]